MPEAVAQTRGVVANGRLIVIGGCSSSCNPTDKVFSYNPLTDAWRNAPSLSVPKYGEVAVLGGFVYIVGGGFAGGTPSMADVERLSLNALPP